MTPMRLLLSLALCMVAQAASAADITGCFSATYDPAHLQKHKGQTPVFLSVLITRQDENTIFEVNTKLRGKNGTWGEAGGCSAKAGALHCSVDCDGGGFDVNLQGASLILTNTQGFRVAQSSCDGETMSHMVEPVPGNRMFTLRRSDGKACE
jgi:hypothetical protein